MARTQLNIKIPEELLDKLRLQARFKGTTVTQYLIDLVNSSLGVDSELTINPQLDLINNRLKLIESKLDSISKKSHKDTPFTELEALNLSNYIKSLFSHNIEAKNFINKKEAWLDYLSSNSISDQISKIFMLRLKEIVLFDDPDMWTVEELDEITFKEKKLEEILESLFLWSDINNPPSLQSICNGS